MKSELSNCAKCPFSMTDRLCKKEDGEAPPFCPTKNKQDLIRNCLNEYEKPHIIEFAKQASVQEADGYANRELGYEHVRPSKPITISTAIIVV